MSAISDDVSRSNSPTTGRESWADVARAGGIILVVAGHVLAVSGNAVFAPVVKAISLFHMPLFFVISGYFFKDMPLVEQLRRRVASLLVPYGAFVFTIFVLDAFISLSAGRRPQEWGLSGITNLVLGGSYAVGKYGILWFLPSLFGATMAYAALVRFGRVAVVASAVLSLVLAAGIGVYFEGFKSPLGIPQIPAGFVAFTFGAELRQRGLGDIALRWWVPGVLVVCAIAAVLGVHFSFDMKALDFGPPVLGLLLAVALSVVFLWAAQLVSRAPVSWLAFVGTSSLTIMMLHQFVQFTLRDFGVGKTAVVFLVALLVPLAVSAAMERSTLTARLYLGRKQGG